MHRVLDSRATDTVECTRGNFNQNISRTVLVFITSIAYGGDDGCGGGSN